MKCKLFGSFMNSTMQRNECKCIFAYCSFTAHLISLVSRLTDWKEILSPTLVRLADDV
jgi:hypothetical protein